VRPSSNAAKARLAVTGARDICVTSRPAPKIPSVRSSTLAMGMRVQPGLCNADGMTFDAYIPAPSGHRASLALLLEGVYRENLI